MWTYARIDRIESGEVHCIFCSRPLRSERLLVIKDEYGIEAYAGPACAKKHLGSPSEPLIDLSRIAMLVACKEPQIEPTEPSEPSENKQKKLGHRISHLEVDEPAHYLRLRVEYMDGFTGNANQRLRELYQGLNSASGLSEDGRLYIERLLAKSNANNLIYSYRNVERCIGAAYWLNIAIQHTNPDRRGFLEQMARSLREHWRLSVKQIEAINRWGVGIRKVIQTFPALDSSAFEGVVAPRFVQTQNSGS